MTRVTLSGPALAVRTCLGRLEGLGMLPGEPRPDGARGTRWAAAVVNLGIPGPAELECALTWWGPADPGLGRPGSEAAVQAAGGLMHLHGREAGRPRRLGIEAASVAAGVLGALGLAAAVLAHRRGRGPSRVETSVLQGGLLAVQQYLARASCAGTTGDRWPRPPAADGPGPPFPTADGRWVELETLSPESWRRFWSTLGIADRLLGPGWMGMQPRYSTARCSMPKEFHEATARRSLACLADLARTSGVSLVALRDYAEVLAEGVAIAGLAHPAVESCGPPGRAGRATGCGSASRSDSATCEPGLPLAGLRAVEVTSRVQGPVAGEVLAMLGATVTRIEPPGGDPARMVAPLAAGAGAGFLAFNRHKDHLELDLATPSGRARLKSLAGDADVFLHNWRVGRAAEWGMAAKDLAALGTAPVHVTASGWSSLAGSCPPIAMDYLAQARAGVGWGMHPEPEPPFPSRLLLADFMGGLLAAEGALAGLAARERTGRAQRVETSLVGGAMALQSHVLEDLAAGREHGRRQGRPLWGTLGHPVPVADGYLALSADDDAELERVISVCGEHGPRCGGEPREAELAARLAGRPGEHWEQALSSAGIPCAVVCQDLAGLCADPMMDGLLEDLGGVGRAPGSPWRFWP